jgi:hypothetical protein
MMFRLRADFNSIRNGVVLGRAADVTGEAPRPLRVDDRVLVHDDGEHEVWGSVTRISSGLVGVALDMDTWADAGTYRLERRDHWLVLTNWALADMTATSADGVVHSPRKSVVQANNVMASVS